LYQRRFDNFAGQWNCGLQQLTTEWVLSLDANYLVPDAFAEEIAALPEDAEENSYFASFDYAVLGRTLRSSLYPPRQVLSRSDKAYFVNDGHRQRLQVTGQSGKLRTRILHDDPKPLGRWIRNHVHYAEQEVEKLISAERSELNLADRLQRTAILGPPAVAVSCLFGKGLARSGWPGWYYTVQRVAAESILALRLIEKRLLA